MYFVMASSTKAWIAACIAGVIRNIGWLYAFPFSTVAVDFVMSPGLNWGSPVGVVDTYCLCRAS